MVDGEVRMQNGPEVILTAPSPYSDPDPALPGVLFYFAAGNSENIQLNGNSTSSFTGTVYAPESNINLLGTADNTTFETQLIGYNVEVGGTADTEVWYCNCTSYSKPTAMDLHR
jgi:hypothetical protein